MSTLIRISLVLMVLISLSVSTFTTQTQVTHAQQITLPRVTEAVLQNKLFFILNSTIPGNVSHVAVNGNFAYIGITNTLTIIDINKPLLPVVQSSYTLRGSSGPTVTAIRVRSNYVYVTSIYRPTTCCLAGTLDILNVEQPTQPQSLGFLTSLGINDVEISNNTAYFTTATFFNPPSTFAIADIAIPHNPTILGSYNGATSGASVAISDTIGYVTDGSSVLVLNINNPTKPTLLTTLKLPAGVAGDVQIAGSYLYITDGGGLQIVDVSNPQHPTLLGYLDTPGTAQSLTVVGQRAYLADGEAGVQLIDVSDPQHPQLYASYNTPGSASEVVVVGNMLYIADGTSGLHLVKMLEGVQQVFLPMVQR